MNMRKQLLVIMLSVAQSASVLSQPGTSEQEPAAPATGPAQLTLDDLRTFTDVFSQVRRNYVEEVDDRTLLDAAIRGMLSDLDPHSDYLASQDYKNLDDTAHGHYSGIGVDVGIEDQKIVIRSIIVPSPADSAGLNPGDIITVIDGGAGVQPAAQVRCARTVAVPAGQIQIGFEMRHQF